MIYSLKCDANPLAEIRTIQFTITAEKVRIGFNNEIEVILKKTPDILAVGKYQNLICQLITIYARTSTLFGISVDFYRLFEEYSDVMNAQWTHTISDNEML
uniref:AlNc14C414G11475 protein n=1 Tax=Albugo laibachii Nc14 TaxID=890382 RepID=F0WZ69_9STRA|nr:AlNc14C414G11475 [Albugo laibachii Nc14]|eukprot:CCA26785.1 AlNc14C414G11475 [Albugo laibachii Nc14]